MTIRQTDIKSCIRSCVRISVLNNGQFFGKWSVVLQKEHWSRLLVPIPLNSTLWLLEDAVAMVAIGTSSDSSNSFSSSYLSMHFNIFVHLQAGCYRRSLAAWDRKQFWLPRYDHRTTWIWMIQDKLEIEFEVTITVLGTKKKPRPYLRFLHTEVGNDPAEKDN